MATATMRRQASEYIPPLQNGDHLSRAEFERRYDATPHLQNAELIEGVVYVPPPVTFEHHGAPHFDLITWLGIYAAFTPGVKGGDNSSLRLDLDNEPQPDAFLRIDLACGGQSRIDRDGYVVGAPELIAEVAASSASYDLHEKLEVYRRHKAREYLVWMVWERRLAWFILRRGRYVALAPGSDGFYRSKVLPGLVLDPSALLRGDMAMVGKVTRQGLETSEHAAFVARLHKAASRKN